MTLVKWNQTPSIFEDVNHWFNQISNNLPMRSPESSLFHPDFEVQESEKEFLVKADLPGMEKKDININLANGMLTVSGERRESKKEQNENYGISEIRYGSFNRSFSLPEDILEDGIKAKMKNGVLELILPRMKPVKPETKQIEIC